MQSSSARRAPLRLDTWLWLALIGACATSAPAPRARPAPAPTRVSVAPAPAPAGLYAADEAVRDALASPLEYVGTGPWPGVDRMHACVFRNPRVLLVNAYCSPKETNALRIDVYSPTRGRVRIYAESRGAISARSRQDYFTFTAESEPPAGPQARLPQLATSMSYAALRDYEQQRYAAYLPACFGGTEFYRGREGCLGPLGPRKAEWSSQNRAFLEHANHDWYRLVGELRTLATRYGREPD
jgi:hypothetical protein